MPASEQITVAPHLVFDAITAGTPGAPLVLLLHGFAESMHCWRAQVACLGDMGYPAYAVPKDAIEMHLAGRGNRQAMEAALAWYRARGAIRGPLGPIRVPTLYIWGDADDTVGRIAAEGTIDFIAAPYRFEVLPGIGHFAADQAPQRVCELMLEHLAAHPA